MIADDPGLDIFEELVSMVVEMSVLLPSGISVAYRPAGACATSKPANDNTPINPQWPKSSTVKVVAFLCNRVRLV